MKPTPTCRAAALLAASLCLALPAQAQFLELLKNLAPTAAGIPAKPAESAASAPLNTLSTANSSSTSAAARKAKIESELAPDRQCNRPKEKFNIIEKLTDYGGSEATLRLERLIASDFKYDDLSKEDREMLRYLAQTTVWLPVELESKLGSAFDLAASRGGDELTPIEEDAFKEVQAQLDKFRALTTDFPAETKLRMNPELADGAFAKFGGLIQISRNMLQTMSERPAGADLLLAHELAHVYKRHAVKRMQFELLSSRDGWELAKKLLQRAQRGASFDPLRDGWFAITVVPQMISFARELQLNFSSEQELEADACAAHWLKTAGLNPTLAWNEFRDSMAASASGGNEQGYGRTHPPTAEREANFVVKLKGKPPAATAAATAPIKPGKATEKPAPKPGSKRPAGGGG